MTTADLRDDKYRVKCRIETFGHEEAYDCRVLLCPEEEGGFSAHCLNLPGVISQGDTVSEAMENIRDAFRETLLYYREAQTSIPWDAVDVERTPGCQEKATTVRI